MSSSTNMTKKQRKKQAKREAKTMLQLEQSRKDVQKAEQKVAKAQAQLEASRIRVRNLEAEIEEMRTPQNQADQAPQPDQTSQHRADQEKDTTSTNQQDASQIASESHVTASTPTGQVTSLLSVEAPTDISQNQEKDTMIPKYGLYAYGLVGKSPKQLDIVGIDKKNKVYPVAGRDICVMVSEIDIDQFQNQVKNLFAELTKTAGTGQSGAGELLQAHEDVLDTLMQHTTVVPFKFGTILTDEKAASKMLQDHEEEFKSLLSKFTGRVEWGLKVYADKQALMKHMMQIGPKFTSLGEEREKLSRGAAYLLGRKMEDELKDRVVARLVQVAEVIFQELGKDASEAKLNNTLPQKVTGKKKELILNAVYLVEREKVAHFCQQGKRFMEEYEFMGLDLEFSGPWPPYNFT
jgi:Gas vesicle synthesis protein GvpL/GvpF